MSEIYYDRKGVGHFSARGRDAANLRYASEDHQSLEELKHQTLLAQDKLRLTNENLAYNQRAAASQQRQADALEQQAKDARNHIQFQADLAWLERSDSVGRLNYLLDRCRNQVVAMLAVEVFCAAKIAKVQVQESFLTVLRQATEAKEQWDGLPGEVEKTQAQLEVARVAAFKGSAGWWFVGYLLLVPSLAIPLAVLLEHGSEPSLTDLGLCMFLILAVTCPIGYKAVKAVRAQHRNRLSAASAQIQLTEQLAATEQERVQLKASLIAISERVKQEYAAWISETNGQLEAVFQQVLRGTSVHTIKEIIGPEEKAYPTTLRINWDQVGRTEMCSTLDELADSVIEQAALAHGPELLVEWLTLVGEPQLAAFVSTSFSPVFGLEWGLGEGEEDDDESEEEDPGR
jgi:hypothetical protein